MIVRIFGVQTKADLGLETYMKVKLRVITTTLTKLPITTNLEIRTAYSVMIHIHLNGCKNLLE